MNRKIYLTAWLALAVFFMASCDKKSSDSESAVIDKNAVTWTSDISEALAKAKKENKMVFVECYSPSCPFCQAVAPYFNTPEVAEKYNSNFINYKLNVEDAEHVKFLNEKGIWLPSFPQFLFFDGDGNLIHQGEVSADAASIIATADDALNPELRTANFKKRFDEGERDFDFMIKYGIYSRLIKDTLQNHRIADALFESFPKEEMGSATSWNVLKKTVSTVENGFFKYWIDHLDAAAAIEKAAGNPGMAENALGAIIQSSINGPAGEKYNTKDLQRIKGYITKAGAGDFADSYVWEYEAKANIREGNKNAALKIGNAMADQFSNSGASLVYITKVFNDHFPDNSYIKSAENWLKKAGPQLTENNQLAEYNYEVARLSKKAGENEFALKSAQDALTVAEKAGLDKTKFVDLINSLK